MSRPSSMSPGRAACSSRAATLTMSPAVKWPPVGLAPVTASPVFTPMRTPNSMPRSRRNSPLTTATSSRISAAARTARKRVVLMHDRDPKDPHHRIADEVLDRPAMALDHVDHALEPPLHRPAQRLGVHPLSKRSRPHDVREDHCHDLAPLVTGPRRRHRRSTRGAKPRLLAEPIATARARLHDASLKLLSLSIRIASRHGAGSLRALCLRESERRRDPAPAGRH